MKKIFIIPLLLLTISSCNFGGEKANVSFSDNYKASTHASIESLNEFTASMGLNRHESIDGTIQAAINIPNALSGSVTSNYAGLIDGRNSESTFKNIKLLFTSLMGTNSVTADEVGIVSYNGDSYASYKNIVDINADLIPEKIKEILKKYNGKWMNLMAENPANMSSEELMGYNIGKNLVTRSFTDLEKYITDYPIWKDTADLGMSGSLHYWSVELDRPQVVSLMKKLSLDFAGTGMTAENVQELEKSLAQVSFSGKMGFDTKNPKISTLEGALTASGKLVTNVAIVKNEDAGSVRLTNPDEKTDIAMNYGKIDKKYTLDVSVKQNDVEMGKMNAYIQKDDGKVREISVEGSAQGMTVSMKHTIDGDSFTGKLSAVVGSMDWSGTFDKDTLKSLKVTGSAPFGSLSANLVANEADDMIRGPVILKVGEEILFSANLGLEVAREKFAMILDVISDTTPAHFDMVIAAKSTPSNRKVIAPMSELLFQDFIKEMDATEVAPDFSVASPGLTDTPPPESDMTSAEADIGLSQ